MSQAPPEIDTTPTPGRASRPSWADPEVAEHRVDHPVVADQRAGVRRRGPSGQRAAARLEHHHGLAGGGGPARGAAEHLRVAHGLHEHRDRAGPRVVDEVVQHVPSGDHRFVAEGDQVGQPDAGHGGEVQHRRRAGAALRQQRHRTRFAGQPRHRGHRHPGGEVGEAEVVRPEQHHTQRLRVRNQLRLGQSTARTRFGVTGGEHHGVADTRRRRVGQRIEGGRLRHHQKRHVHRLTDPGARGYRRPAVCLGTAAVDQVRPVREAELDQVAVRQLGEHRLVRRTDHRDGAWAEQCVEPTGVDHSSPSNQYLNGSRP
ncbi:MAG: hypothetical protein QOF99_6501 [Pseudonocardiales bacterium]|nr:hypothetical protein [Pseudonocardiales bacterium]